ncbi:hypothetical protein KC367_g1671 [Hortaea werneckii]|uniref:CsbD-like domain-containing protein n=2 Tax=Hortaea werneckii TaxID=91943 RepID=A0A3M7JBG9_HORWE|nr:hypothetical protein KC350_g9346 [Hortaea werneckii]OTA22413.1 hypothetical protein BTJ68_14467 [Hortaea werneckii EXF-2000]KAI6840509.1 hypothetical protein KC342_g2841 [Hortaea werneckii]KAI6844913.1 hypothetical protein KC358_g3623 [Hortaea werneckii]KAI6930883.1 hypothetical protein KC341_g9939 [Hortaea werneckii]
MASDKNTSTLQSYVDSASSAAQSALGSITGNTADKQQAADKQREAEAKDTLSHAGGSVGPFSVSSGGVAKNDSERQGGQWDQTMGSAKETVGNLVGAEGLKKEGRDQNAQGQAREAQGQLSDLGSGVADRAKGTVGGAVAGAMGNEKAQKDYQDQHDTGKTLQRGAEADIQKQA